MSEKEIELNLYDYLEKFASQLVIENNINKNEFTKLLPNQNFSLLKKDLPFLNFGGVYIYTFREKIIYVGKASRLISRLNAHWREMNEEHYDCTVFWQVYFNYHKTDDLNLYVISVKDDLDQIAIEKYLQRKLKPDFDSRKNLFKNSVKIKNSRHKPKTPEYLEAKKIIISFLESDIKK